MTSAFERTLAAVIPVDRDAEKAAEERQDRLTKPRGALGEIERIGTRLAAIAGTCPPPIPAPAAVAVFAGDHGVIAEGVTPWPQEVTAQMVANFLAGGAAVNVLARQAGASVTVVDVGVASRLQPASGLVIRKVRAGSGNLCREAAMSLTEARSALDVGVEIASSLVADGARALVTGEMGIGNTTASAAIIATFTGQAPADVTGRGTGIDDAMLARKIEVVEQACARAAGAVGALASADPVAFLAELGGLEIAALAGFVIGGAAARVPVVVDGVIALAATIVATTLCPAALGYCIAGHRSTEPGASAALTHLGLRPLVDLELRLGEGTGACLALPMLEAAARILDEMATFDGAGVTEKTD